MPPVVVEVARLGTAETEETTPMDRAIAALATFGPEGARAVEWQKRCEDRGGPKSGSFYAQKDRAVAAGRVVERDGRFFVTGEDAVAPADVLRSAGLETTPQLTPPSIH